MNAAIHPHVHDTLVRCATCGSEHALRSTRAALSVEICSSCHPVYTGREQRIASGGRIERFEARRLRAQPAGV